MECLWLIFALTGLFLLCSIFNNLNQIQKETKIIMSKQNEFNEKIGSINAAIETVGEAVASEAQQTRDFIASLPPEVDTSALDGIATRLSGLATSVGDIFVPAAPDDEPPVDDLPADEAPDDVPTGKETPTEPETPVGDGR